MTLSGVYHVIIYGFYIFINLVIDFFDAASSHTLGRLLVACTQDDAFVLSVASIMFRNANAGCFPSYPCESRTARSKRYEIDKPRECHLITLVIEHV